MHGARTVPATTDGAGLVVGDGTLLLRGARNAPFGRVPPVVPGWRLLVARPGPLAWRTAGRAQHVPALLVPPDVHVDAVVVDETAILHLDACTFGLPPTSSFGRPGGVVPWFTVGDGLRESLWSVADVGALECSSHDVLGELRRARLLPPASPRDPRVIVGLDAARALGNVTEAAAAVGLSRGRFRNLVRDQVGSAPTRLRVWQRLCWAVSLMAGRDLAEAAAAAGFADQPHLTRTCTRFLGASPGRLRPLLHPASPRDLRVRGGAEPCGAALRQAPPRASTGVISSVA